MWGWAPPWGVEVAWLWEPRLPYVLPGSALLAHAFALVFPGKAALVLAVLLAWGWLAALGELGGECRGA